MFALCFSLEFTPNLLLPTTPVNEALDLVKLWKKEVAEWKVRVGCSGVAENDNFGLLVQRDDDTLQGVDLYSLGILKKKKKLEKKGEVKEVSQAHDEKMGCKTIPQEYIYENGVQSKRVSSSQVHSSK
ncbi:hypothetical protein V1478_005918 [Vespula squamosa]|uniref:Uncharacterized protein n=1 Tax=Vespula squamosa TaxID=30214 RepID=A0ABD2BA60_VESSQ